MPLLTIKDLVKTYPRTGGGAGRSGRFPGGLVRIFRSHNRSGEQSVSWSRGAPAPVGGRNAARAPHPHEISEQGSNSASEHRVVEIAAFALDPGEQLALRGESGSGKTTFLNLIAGILAPDSGSIQLDGREVTALGEAGRDRLRAETIGYIFQTFNLLQGHTVLENVELGMAFGRGVDRAHAIEMLRRVGLGDKHGHFPNQLSTGQQQRVAVARALVNRPKLVLADEPTGNLDRRNAREALYLIREVCREEGAALLLVSHDERVLAQFEQMKDFAFLNRAMAS